MLNFLNNFYDYPIVQEQSAIAPLLRDDLTRAVVYAAPDLVFDGTQITDDKNFTGANSFWRDKNQPKGLYADPGKTEYTLNTLTPKSVREEAAQAGMVVREKTALLLFEMMVLAANIFSNVTKDYLNRDDFYMRVWQMWGTKKNLGRTPFLHIDRTHLTGLWYADRASAEIYTGEVPKNVWDALSPQRKNEHQNDPVLRNFSEQVMPDDLVSMPRGSLIVTKNSKAKDLDNESDRRSVCIHRSGNVPKLGQAGIVMVPKFTG